MQLKFAARVDIGPKATNDDRVLIAGRILDECSYEGTVETPTIVAVCDGCGGYAGGGIAAQAVLEFLSREETNILSDDASVVRALGNCEDQVREKKREMPQYSAMCTTIAGCAFCEDHLLIFHAGDSRVYRCDHWGLAKMTRDHSVVQEMVDMGEITPEEARVHPKRNVINRCIGIAAPPPEVYVSRTPIAAGETYLFCSDGLWESVPDAEIQEVLNSEMTLAQKADVLVDKALKNGANDNVSVCICSAVGDAAEMEDQPFELD